jgi:proteic killer suppression protein
MKKVKFNHLNSPLAEAYLPKTACLRYVKKFFTLAWMIASFKHKGLQALFEHGTSAKLQKALAERALRRLDAIDVAKTPEALNVPGFNFHGLQGKPKRFSVHVNGPWCITFEWQGENAVKIDFENYH